MIGTVALLMALAAPDLVKEPIVLDFCRELARRYVDEPAFEHGAFVVATREGLLYFVMWPPSGEQNSLRWSGRFPAGTVAIVHTHPSRDPAPSRLDVGVARRSGIPVYVITLYRISKTTGGAPETVLNLDWPAGKGKSQLQGR